MPSKIPYETLAAALPVADAEMLLEGFKSYAIVKSDLGPCNVCTVPTPHAMRTQRLACKCSACTDAMPYARCPWRGRVKRCQLLNLATIQEAYVHVTPCHGPRKPTLTSVMRTTACDWAEQGLKPKRIWDALRHRFRLDETAMPPLSTVQNLVHHHVSSRLGGSDRLNDIRAKVRASAFTGQEEETAAFSMAWRMDGDRKPTVGDGSDKDPFIVGFSSKKLLRQADRDADAFILHLDATYKITQVGYPVLVVGLSDSARSFHLLGVFIISQQQQPQYTEVLALLRRAYMDVVGKPLVVRYVMGDADAAQLNALQEVFGPDTSFKFLMCYFHVAKKVFEKTRSLAPSTRARVMADLNDLHYAVSEGDFHALLAQVQANWAQLPELTKFSSYFSTVWLNARVKRWQSFHTPPGFATTNNPCETYNAALKRDVTLRRKLKVGELIDKLLLHVESESTRSHPFVTSPVASVHLIRRARVMANDGLITVQQVPRTSIAFLLGGISSNDGGEILRVTSRVCNRVYDSVTKRSAEDLLVTAQMQSGAARMEVQGMPQGGWSVNTNNRTCPCAYWTKFGACVHVLAALAWSGLVDGSGRETLVYRGPRKQHQQLQRRSLHGQPAGRPRNIQHVLHVDS